MAVLWLHWAVYLGRSQKRGLPSFPGVDQGTSQRKTSQPLAFGPSDRGPAAQGGSNCAMARTTSTKKRFCETASTASASSLSSGLESNPLSSFAQSACSALRRAARTICLSNCSEDPAFSENWRENLFSLTCFRNSHSFFS